MINPFNDSTSYCKEKEQQNDEILQFLDLAPEDAEEFSSSSICWWSWDAQYKSDDTVISSYDTRHRTCGDVNDNEEDHCDDQQQGTGAAPTANIDDTSDSSVEEEVLAFPVPSIHEQSGGLDQMGKLAFPVPSIHEQSGGLDPMGKLTECMERSALSRSLVEAYCNASLGLLFKKEKTNHGQIVVQTKSAVPRRKESTRKHSISKPVKSKVLLRNQNENCAPCGGREDGSTGTNFRLTGLKCSSSEKLTRLAAKLQMLKLASASKKDQVMPPAMHSNKFRRDLDFLAMPKASFRSLAF
jgi:hypothetical protein